LSNLAIVRKELFWYLEI